MKQLFRQVFKPLLHIFESGEGEYLYKPSQRKILLIVGVLFWVLSTASAAAAISTGENGGFVPFAIFFSIGLVCEVVGVLGSDRAVAKIWGNK